VADTGERGSEEHTGAGRGMADPIQRWKFKPGEKDGVPVPVMAQIEVNFKLM
jgi:hypothetical protein